MADKPVSNHLIRLGQRARDRTLSLRERGKESVMVVQKNVAEQLSRVAHDRFQNFLERLTAPQNAELLQEQLARVAQLGFVLGFRVDPNAGLLFEFVDWLQQRHGRERVLQIVLTENLLTDGRLLHLLTTYATLLSPLGGPAAHGTGHGGGVSAAELEDFKTEGGRQLLALLCELAALESEEPCPLKAGAGASEAMLAYYESSPIPAKFVPLAAMASGRPEAFSRPSPGSAGLAGKAASSLKRLTRSVAGESGSGLVRSIPGINDPTLRFIVFSYTFFLQTFMLRTLIEGLPDLLSDITPEASQRGDDGDLIDMK